MYLGCAWYPEHWDEKRWREDLRLMRDAGMNMVRVAEFAWSRLEPEEGQFDFDWLERSIALAAEYGLETVVGTPTAAPPAWLTQRYPETLSIRPGGQRAQHGGRCHCSPLNLRFRTFCRRIAEEMAARFGKNPHVIGWQIDNEFHAFSHGEEDRTQFQEWLQTRYASLDEMNQAWSTAYWSQEYTDWAQIPMPTGGQNPGLLMAWWQFVTAGFCDFQRTQITAIRAHADARQWITHNMMGWHDGFDHYELCKELDLASWDNYVGTGHLDYLTNGSAHDLTRGFKQKNFWLMEIQPGSVNWSTINNALDHGEARAMAWHAVGHGCDAILYWQWRSALGGQEQYHGTLVAQDGTPRPLYTEVAQMGQEFAQAADVLRDTTPAPQVAILHSYQDRWSINYQKHHQDFDPVKHINSYYRPLRQLTHDMDIVHPSAALTGYRLVVAPHLHILTPELAQHLLDYVAQGGHLVLGPRSGFKDPHNALLPTRQPGPLADAAGAYVEEFYALLDPVTVAGALGEGEVKIWAEWLTPNAKDAEVLLRYGACNGWLDGQAAVTTRRVGAGRITYVGAWLDEALMARLAAWLLESSGVQPAFGPTPEGVEVCRRVGNGNEVFLLINHTPTPQQVALPSPMADVISGQQHQGTITLPPREVLLLTPDLVAQTTM